MPLLAYFISGSFLAATLFRVLAALGFSVVGFVGLDNVLDSLQSQMNSYFTGLPLTAKQLLDMAGITTIVFWIVQAYAASALLRVGRSFLMRSSQAS